MSQPAEFAPVERTSFQAEIGSNNRGVLGETQVSPETPGFIPLPA